MYIRHVLNWLLKQLEYKACTQKVNQNVRTYLDKDNMSNVKTCCSIQRNRWRLEDISCCPLARSPLSQERLEPHVCIPRSCSGSARSCPFTYTPTNELGAKHDVITPIWLQTSPGTGQWSAVSPDKATQTRAMTYLCQPPTLRIIG